MNSADLPPYADPEIIMEPAGREADEILASIEKEAQGICFRQPSATTEYKLANLIACLAAVILHERKIARSSGRGTDR